MPAGKDREIYSDLWRRIERKWYIFAKESKE
jgi:hypothetical protein